MAVEQVESEREVPDRLEVHGRIEIFEEFTENSEARVIVEDIEEEIQEIMEPIEDVY